MRETPTRASGKDSTSGRMAWRRVSRCVGEAEGAGVKGGGKGGGGVEREKVTEWERGGERGEAGCGWDG